VLLVDDILLFPATSLLWIFRELSKAVQQEMADEAENITHQLSELYMMLETGRITETEFDSREATLLDRLDELQAEREMLGEADEGDEVEPDFEDGAAVD